jgi:hypothetical protein
MDKEAWNIFFVVCQYGARPLVSVKPVVLSNCGPEKKIVDDSGIDFLLQKPSSRRIGAQRNRVVILHAPLPAAEGG